MEESLDGINIPVEGSDFKQMPQKAGPEIKVPAAHKPRVDWDDIETEITSDPYTSPEPDWNQILIDAGYDTDNYEVVEPIKVSQWDAQTSDGIQKLWSYKVGVRRKDQGPRNIDYLDLVKEVKKHRKFKEQPSGDNTFVVCVADWQIGKLDQGGSPATVERILNAIDLIEDRVRDLRKIDRDIGRLVIAGIGDIVESCDQSYPSQTFSVDLNYRQQKRVARRLIRDLICRLSKMFNEVVVTAVPGNHGELRSGGRMYTSRGDNDDVAIFEEIADILAVNPEAYGHVEFRIPEDDLYVVMEISGTPVCFAHGHITKGGSDPRKKLHDWWQDQVFGNRPPGRAKILVTGHYHHLSWVEYGDRIHVQAPSMDGGSDWWDELTGEVSRSGVLTFVMGPEGYPKDLEVIGGGYSGID